MESSDFVGCLYPPENVLLFSIDSEFHSDLDRGNISEDLRQEFLKNEISLHKNTNISILKKGSSWRIRKKDGIYQMGNEASEKTFFIRKKDGDLNVYEEKVKISFRGVTDFSQMLIQWEGGENKRSGLKGHLEYDETFYIALIKNYQDMGWLSQADDAYYNYRREKRIRSSFLRRVVELIFLEIPFGYGVEPLKLLRSFLILWGIFGLYYVGFLRQGENCILPWWRAWNPFRYKCRCFAWALIHSFDILTPGIDIDSLTDPFLEESPFIFRQKSKAVIWGQRVQKLLGWYLLALFFILFGKIWIR